MNLSEEASAATMALLAGVEMQRFHVHTRETIQGDDDEVDVKGSTPRLVLFAESVPGESVNWWYADDDGFLLSADASNIMVCGGRECPVEGCTRATMFRETEAGYGATPASEALDLLPSPLTEGENQAITEYHRGIEAEIANLADFLEREFPEPLVPRGAAAVLGEVHRLLLELKSRRAEQGKLADHPSDSPITRIRFWMEHHYPAEQSETLPLSEWVIGKLDLIADLQAQIELRKETQRSQLVPIVEAVSRLFEDIAYEALADKGWMSAETAIPTVLEMVAERLKYLETVAASATTLKKGAE